MNQNIDHTKSYWLRKLYSCHTACFLDEKQNKTKTPYTGINASYITDIACSLLLLIQNAYDICFLKGFTFNYMGDQVCIIECRCPEKTQYQICWSWSYKFCELNLKHVFSLLSSKYYFKSTLTYHIRYISNIFLPFLLKYMDNHLLHRKKRKMLENLKIRDCSHSMVKFK